MPRIIEGKLTAKGLRFGIVVSRFNDFICNHLLSGALDVLLRNGAEEGDIEVFKVPGAFEIPQAAKKVALSKRFDAVICLGAVIRGATAHFDYVAGNAASGIASVALSTGIPCIFGVLTTDTVEQAIERAGTKAGNKGYDAAVTAIEMANLMRKLGAERSR